LTWLAAAAIHLVAVLNLVIRDLSQERDKHVESVGSFTMTVIAVALTDGRCSPHATISDPKETINMLLSVTLC